MDEKERMYKLTVRMPASLKAELDELRAHEHRSLHAEIMKAIDEHIARAKEALRER